MTALNPGKLSNMNMKITKTDISTLVMMKIENAKCNDCETCRRIFGYDLDLSGELKKKFK